MGSGRSRCTAATRRRDLPRLDTRSLAPQPPFNTWEHGGVSLGSSFVPENRAPPANVTQVARGKSGGSSMAFVRVSQGPCHLLLIAQKCCGQRHSQKQNRPNPSG